MVSGIGANEVIIETPRHETEFCSLPAEQIALVMLACRQRIADLYRDQRFRYVMVFKNYGKGAGASGIVHSHSELIALPATPRRIKDELNGARDYFEYKERCIYCDIIEDERAVEKRILLETKHFLVFAPYASRFPFELTVIPKRHECTFEAATDAELTDMGSVMKRTLKAVHDVLLDPPYNFVLHTAPNLLPKSGYWKTIKDDYHWHVEIIPRVKRVAGFEWGSGFHINPVAPERAIKALRTRVQG
jgi:UDPglucose--hexose-1-phosphate uridylyltransferase